MQATALTKTQESNLLESFISSLPTESYLSDYMQGAAAHFEYQMRQDMVFPLISHISEIERQIRTEAEKLKAVRAQVAEQQTKVADAQRSLGYVRGQINQMEKLAGEIRDAADNIGHTASRLPN